MKKIIIIAFATLLSSCSSMSTLEDIENNKPSEIEVVNKDISTVFNDIARNAKFCFANNSATNYTVHSNLNGNSGEIIVMTGAELVSANIWLVARLEKQGNNTKIKYTAGNSIWKRWVNKMRRWAIGKSGC